MHGSEGLAGGEAGKAAIYSVELSMFEGPLDLLLHLVRRHELDILDIPIAFVAEKYLEYLHLMRSLDLEVAGDYLVMAATLAWLKSRELLPPEPREGEATGADDEEGEDPREALIRRLVEYERFKSAAAELDAMPVSGRDVFARGADIDVPPLDPGLAPVTLFRLAEAYYRVLTRAKINKTHDVTIEAVTVAQRMQQLTLMLDERQEFDFEGLFLSRTWSSEHELRSMLVVTLMSVLELVKLGVARVQQVPDTEAIRVYRLVASEEARKLIESYDEEQSFGAPVEPGPAQPTEAELDAIEERTLLAEALAGLSGPDDDGPDNNLGELGVLAEELDPEVLPEPTDADEFAVLADEADLGPEAIAAAAANSDPTDASEPADTSDDDTFDDLPDGTGREEPPDLAASEQALAPAETTPEPPAQDDTEPAERSGEPRTDDDPGQDDTGPRERSDQATADSFDDESDLSEAPGSVEPASDVDRPTIGEMPDPRDVADRSAGEPEPGPAGRTAPEAAVEPFDGTRAAPYPPDSRDSADALDMPDAPDRPDAVASRDVPRYDASTVDPADDEPAELASPSPGIAEASESPRDDLSERPAQPDQAVSQRDDLSEQPDEPGAPRRDDLSEQPDEPGASRRDDLSEQPDKPGSSPRDDLSEQPDEPGASRRDDLSEQPDELGSSPRDDLSEQPDAADATQPDDAETDLSEAPVPADDEEETP